METDVVAVSISISKPKVPDYSARDWEIVGVAGKNVISLVINLAVVAKLRCYYYGNSKMIANHFRTPDGGIFL